MAAKIGALRIDLLMNSAAFLKGTDEAQRRMAKMQKDMRAVSRRMQRLGKSMSLAMTLPLAGVAAKSMQNQKVQERAVAAVEAALASMGETAGYTSKKLQDMASQLQKESLYGDEQILSDVTANLLTFGKVQGDVFARAQQSALDLSARLGQDLQSSTVMLGKALNDPAKGVSALSRVGVSFTKVQIDQIKAMQQAGDVAGAQTLILAELEKQYKGQAKAARETDSGRAEAAMGRIADASERIGAIILPIWASIAEKLANVAEQFTKLSPPVQKAIVGIGALAATVGPLTVGLGFAVGAMANLAPIAAVAVRGAAGLALAFKGLALQAGAAVASLGLVRGALVATGVGALVVGVGLLANEFLKLVERSGGIRAAFSQMWASLGRGIDWIKEKFAIWRANLSATWSGAMASILERTNSAINSVIGLFTGSVAAIVAAWGTLKDEIVAKLQGLPAEAFGVAQDMANQFIKGIQNSAARVRAALKSVFSAPNGLALNPTETDGRKIGKQAEPQSPANATIPSSAAGGGDEIENYLKGLSGSDKVDGGAAGDRLGVAIGEGMVAGTRRALGIRSPSKEGILIGGYFSDGVEGGAGADTLGARMASATAKAFSDEMSKQHTGAGLEMAARLRSEADGYAEAARMLARKTAQVFTDSGEAAGEMAEKIKPVAPVVEQTAHAAADVAIQFAEAGAAGVKAFEAIEGGAKSAGIEAAKVSGVLSDFIGGFAKGDLGGFAGQILGRGETALTGLLNSAFSPDAKTGKIGGLGGVFASLKSSVSGIGSALSGLGSGGVGAAISGISGALGAAMPLIGLGSALFKGLKPKVSDLDAGLKVVVGRMGATAEAFRKTETSRFWGLSKKTETIYSAASAAIEAGVSNSAAMIREGVEANAAALGVASGALDGFTTQIKVSTKDMTEDQALQAIQSAMSGLSDEMAQAVIGTRDYIAAGETASAALSRMSGALTAANPALERLQMRLFDVSIAGGAAASAFADLFGGIEGMAGATGFFFENFYSDAEKMDVATASLRKQMAALSLDVMPATIGQVRELAKAFDASGNRKGLAAVLQAAPVMKSIFDANAAGIEAAKAAADVTIRDARAAADAALRDAKSAADVGFDAAKRAGDKLVDAAQDAAQTLVDAVKDESHFKTRADFDVASLSARAASADKVSQAEAKRAAMVAQAEAKRAAMVSQAEAKRAAMIARAEQNAAAKIATAKIKAGANQAASFSEAVKRAVAVQSVPAVKPATAAPRAATPAVDKHAAQIASITATARRLLGSKSFWGRSDYGANSARVEGYRQQIRDLGAIPSFNGGGYTGRGNRSGGIDGKGGMLLIGHPDETFTDHSDPNNVFERLLLSQDAVRAEISGLRSEQRQLVSRVAVNTRALADLERRREEIGVPKERSTAGAVT